MNLISRLSKGKEIAKISLSIILKNKSLLFFPIISSISAILIFATFFAGSLFMGISLSEGSMKYVGMALLFFYYLFLFTIITFFNVGLIHCATKIFNNETTSIGEGIRFAGTKMVNIVSWAAISATVGLILKMLTTGENQVGKVIAAMIGTAWTVLTFFVVPIMVYKDMGPIAAIQESGKTISEKWGESLGGTFSFALVNFLGIVLIGLIAYGTSMINFTIAIGVFVVGLIFLFSVTSAANTVFVAAAYNNMNKLPSGAFRGELIDDLFVVK